MSLAALQLYFSFNSYLILLSFIWFIYSLYQKHGEKRPHYSFVLKLQYMLLISFFVFGLLTIYQPPVSNSSIIELLSSSKEGALSVVINSELLTNKEIMLTDSLPEKKTHYLILIVGSILVALSFFVVFKNLIQLKRLIQGSYLFKKTKNVKFFCSQFINEPFSFCFSNDLYIMVPEYIIEKPQMLRTVFRHEIQHHRQKDTYWAYLLVIIKIICFWNPFAHTLVRRIYELQEFACDEALIKKKRLAPQAYIRHLFWVAERAHHSKKLSCAVGFLSDSSQLKWRIKEMIKIKCTQQKWPTAYITAASFLCFFTAAWSAKGVVQDRRISFEQALSLATKSEAKEFPLSINDDVLKSLNYFISNEAGRTKMREALERMDSYKPLIEAKLDDYSMPTELMAIPIIESGYQNLPDTNTKGWGAGIWMFIRSTARNFGLRVDSTMDERMNEELLTDAAMRLLSANKLRFKNWHLSVLAYYAGEGKVQKYIQKTGSRDPWVLVEAGVEEKRGYLANVIAAAIILKNPSLIQ